MQHLQLSAFVAVTVLLEPFKYLPVYSINICSSISSRIGLSVSDHTYKPTGLFRGTLPYFWTTFIGQVREWLQRQKNQLVCQCSTWVEVILNTNYRLAVYDGFKFCLRERPLCQASNLSQKPPIQSNISTINFHCMPWWPANLYNDYISPTLS